MDRFLADVEKIALGGTELTMHLHPGHAKGAMSLTTTIQKGGKPHRVGIFNMGSNNAGVDRHQHAGISRHGRSHRKTFQEQKALELDVFLASHAAQLDLHQKYKLVDA